MATASSNCGSDSDAIADCYVGASSAVCLLVPAAIFVPTLYFAHIVAAAACWRLALGCRRPYNSSHIREPAGVE